ncbi:MAG: M1 family metallopeptidase, partial [Thermoanaerobaculia bacterium]
MIQRALSLVLLVLAPLAHAATVRLGDTVVPILQSVALTTDPRSDSYSGSVTIELDVRHHTSSFLFHARDLTITSLKLSKGTRPLEATHAAGEDGTVAVTTTPELTPGRHTLAIEFTNKYNRTAVGLYKMTLSSGEPYLFTQFLAIDARRAFPSFDEPRFKIPYELALTIPAQYDALANTPVASETKTEESKTIRFARTKPLPSYLVAMAVGQFELTP